MKDEIKKEDELDQVQEDLIREDQEENEEEMPVDGKSVFDLKKLKNLRTEEKENNKQA